MPLRVQRLTAEAFAPFGMVVARPDGAPAASLAELDYWSDIATLPPLDAPLSLGFASLRVVPMVQTALERHLLTFEVLVPVGGDVVVVVGPPHYPNEPRRLPGVEHLRAFRVRERQAVVFHAAVWHYAPFAVDRAIGLFVASRAGTAASDAYVVQLAPAVKVEVP